MLLIRAPATILLCRTTIGHWRENCIPDCLACTYAAVSCGCRRRFAHSASAYISYLHNQEYRTILWTAYKKNYCTNWLCKSFVRLCLFSSTSRRRNFRRGRDSRRDNTVVAVYKDHSKNKNWRNRTILGSGYAIHNHMITFIDLFRSKPLQFLEFLGDITIILRCVSWLEKWSMAKLTAVILYAITAGIYMIRYDLRIYLTCAQKLTSSQLSVPHDNKI